MMHSGTQPARGFTLAEIIFVVAIIGLLAAIALANFTEGRKKANDAQRISDLKQIQLALRVYRDANGSYPREADGANGTIGEGSGLDTLLTPYMPQIPHDPLGPDNSEYNYYYDALHPCDNVYPAPNNLKVVVFAKTMERSSDANWTEVCDGPGTEGGPNENTYMIVLGASSG